MPRFLTPDEVSLIHRLLPETTELSERLLKDLALAQVEDVEVVGFGGVVFLSSTTQLFGSDIATAMLADADGVPVRVTLCRIITISSSSWSCARWTSRRSSASI
ncbi:hypothetical protein NMB32_19010 [Stenotrophomonas sp. CD2]|nr:hypothetical protein NMB32_19010 [Stenotrophomonas sp. CD2]